MEHFGNKNCLIVKSNKTSIFGKKLLSLMLAFVISFMLFISNSFAVSDVEILQAAIRTNDIQEAKRVLNNGKIDFDELYVSFSLPSVEMAELLLKNEKNQIDPDYLMLLIVELYIEPATTTTGFFSAVYHLFLNRSAKNKDSLYSQKKELVKLVLSNGGKANSLMKFILQQSLDQDEWLKIALDILGSFENISFTKEEIYIFEYLPSFKSAKLLLENSFDSSIFLAVVLAAGSRNHNHLMTARGSEKFEEEQKYLINMALEKGAGLQKVEKIGVLPSYEAFKALLDNAGQPISYWKLIGLVFGSDGFYLEESDGFYLEEQDKDKIDLAEKIVELILQKASKDKTQLYVYSKFSDQLLALSAVYFKLNFDGAWQVLRRIYNDKFVKISNIIFSVETHHGKWISFIHRVAVTYLDIDNEIHDLLVSGKELPVYGSKGVPLLCYAAIKKNNKLLLKLIENSFFVDIQDSQGNTPLMLAILSGNKEGANILLKNGANVNIVNNFNSTALHIEYCAHGYVDNEYISSLVNNYRPYPFIVDRFGTNPVVHILEEILPCMLGLEGACYSAFKLSADTMLLFSKNTIYELLVKKAQGESILNIRTGGNDKITYIGIVTDKGYYSDTMFYVATKMMVKHRDIQLRIITPNMIDDDFIQQFDGLIVPGAADNFPQDKQEFAISDLKQDTMLSIEKLYQNVLGLAEKYDIPTIGMCSGNQHTILYNKGFIKPVKGYDGNDHKATFVSGSIPHFLALTPREQRQALESCSLPDTTIDISTAHHYAGVTEKLGAVKLGAVSEEGVVQSVYKGTKSFSFQFHPENYYDSNESYISGPNRNTIIWENFLNICRQRHRYYLHARESNVDHKDAMQRRGEQNKEIIARLEECAAHNTFPQQEEIKPLVEDRDFVECKKLHQNLKESGLSFRNVLLETSSNGELTALQKCDKYDLDYEYDQGESVEGFRPEESICDKDHFQWSDYEVLN